MKETYFEKLHPALCFAYFALAICFSALVQHPAYLIANVLGALCLNISQRGLAALKRFARVIPFWLFLSLINPLLNTLGEHVLFSYWGMNYTLEALCYGMVISGMFIAMLEWFTAYNAVMTEDKFSYLFASLAPSTALLLTTVLRMIPNHMRKAGQIASVRKSIGMGAVENASAREKINSGMTTLSALTSWALEGSVVTSDSMNSRGYGAGKRTCYHSYRFACGDACVGAVFSLLLCVFLIGLLRGAGGAEFTPEMRITPIAGAMLPSLIAYTLFLLLPTLLNLKEEIQWSISRSKI